MINAQKISGDVHLNSVMLIENCDEREDNQSDLAVHKERGTII
ncbi:hypothetical protein [Pontibacillus yanchengensis]|nr:hypothetical protein [Pontibacillus yanchengensis]